MVSRNPILPSWLQWSLYLGVSWTWCIGMFLPVLLARDFGLWGFFSFAIPNILGAAVMPFVLSATASSDLTTRHGGAAITFSRVTIAYQAFFAGWMLTQLLGWFSAFFYLLIPVVLLFGIRRDRDFTITSLLTFLASLAVGFILLFSDLLSLPPPRGLHGAAAIAPVCLVGFALCPYLDLTFHNALRRAHADGGTGTSRVAFLVGFLLIFGPMIVLTLGYHALIHTGPAWARALIGTHILLQLVVTVILHQIESAKTVRAASAFPLEPKPLPPLWPIVIAWFVVGLGVRFVPDIGGWAAGEYVYRTFLAFYGLLVPAYVLLRIITPAPLRLLGAAVLLALPFYAIGFLTQHTWYLLPGAAILLVAHALARMTARPGSSQHSS